MAACATLVFGLPIALWAAAYGLMSPERAFKQYISSSSFPRMSSQPSVCYSSIGRDHESCYANIAHPIDHHPLGDDHSNRECLPLF